MKLEKQFKSSAERMIGAIIVAVFLILFTFHSVKISLMILFSIPLTIIGASWTMLAIGYHVSMLEMMGFMLGYSSSSQSILLLRES